GEEYSRRRAGIDLGGDARGHAGEIHLGPAIALVAPRQRRLPTQAKVQCQTAVNAVVVLKIETEEGISIGLELAGSLLECKAVAYTGTIGQDAGKKKLVGSSVRESGAADYAGEIVVRGTEAEQSRLVELIIEIHLAFLDRTAKMQLVLAS